MSPCVRTSHSLLPGHLQHAGEVADLGSPTINSIHINGHVWEQLNCSKYTVPALFVFYRALGLFISPSFLPSFARQLSSNFGSSHGWLVASRPSANMENMSRPRRAIDTTDCATVLMVVLSLSQSGETGARQPDSGPIEKKQKTIQQSSGVQAGTGGSRERAR